MIHGYSSLGIKADHRNVGKFNSLQDPGYATISSELWRWTKQNRDKMLTASTRYHQGNSSQYPMSQIQTARENATSVHQQRVDINPQKNHPPTPQEYQHNIRRHHQQSSPPEWQQELPGLEVVPPSGPSQSQHSPQLTPVPQSYQQPNWPPSSLPIQNIHSGDPHPTQPTFNLLYEAQQFPTPPIRNTPSPQPQQNISANQGIVTSGANHGSMSGANHGIMSGANYGNIMPGATFNHGNIMSGANHGNITSGANHGNITSGANQGIMMSGITFSGGSPSFINKIGNSA
jgi:hypothetical protein